MRLQKKHRRIMGALLEGDDVIGMGAANIANILHYYNSFRIYGVLNDLLEAGYIQNRVEGNPWPGERRSPDVKPNKTPRTFYRLTREGKEAFSR